MVTWSAHLVRVGATLAAVGAAHTAVNAALLRRPARTPAPVTEAVSVLLPVRNEAHQIEPCLRALQAQSGVPRLEILVLDDESTDDTAARARDIARNDPRITIVSGDTTPPGWLGKPHACWQLAQRAAADATIFVYVDADVRLEPTAILSTVDLMRAARLDFVSPYPRLEAKTTAERLIQPLLPWSWLTFLPVRLAENSPRPSLTAVGGQFLAISRAAYERCGGHRAVRADVLEDLALARAAKRSGARGGVVDGSALASCRMYEDWPQLREGYGKSLWQAFGSQPGAAAVFALLGLAYVAPAAAALRGSRAGLFGYLAAVAGRTVAARRTGGRICPDVLAHPASVALAGWLTARSIVAHHRGTLRWKDRAL
jgi:glycosyl transferase family 2